MNFAADQQGHPSSLLNKEPQSQLGEFERNFSDDGIIKITKENIKKEVVIMNILRSFPISKDIYKWYAENQETKG